MNKSTGTRLTLYMTVAVLASFAIILIMNAAAFLGVVPSRYISPNDVRGIAVEHHQKLYTLNFKQQNDLIDIFNRFFPVGKEVVESRKVKVNSGAEIEKIIVYRFNTPDLEIIPIAYVSKSASMMEKNEANKTSMVFSIPEWNANGLLEESTSDELNKLLLSTYNL